ncbi:hypothetical protein [Flavobacterium sp.]|uniref:hypothetical protein n=1 Tax=Flavobacterium sp. TaxID=239 RepID=UPI002FDB4D4E
MMLKKYSVLLGMCMSVLLLLIATMVYPGGSMFDKNSVGFEWSKNFISNLFGAKAVNGLDNPARIWAIGGMFFLSASLAVFFINFSKKIPAKGAAKVVKYLGGGGMLFTFLIATPLHDIMVTMASTLFLLGLFYITVFVFKSKLHFFKFLCVVCLLLFYSSLYIFGIRDYIEYLPILQKITFSSVIILVVGLEYFTQKEDFQHIKVGKQKKSN